MGITQYHTRISELKDNGYDIIPSPFTDEYGFKSYRLPVPKKWHELTETANMFAGMNGYGQ